MRKPLLIALFSSSLAAAHSICFSHLADPPPLIRAPYKQISDQLGTKMTPETLRKMAEGKDPFTVPEEADALMLQKRLNEFKTMLAQKGWDTQSLRAELLAELRNERLGREKAQR